MKKTVIGAMSLILMAFLSLGTSISFGQEKTESAKNFSEAEPSVCYDQWGTAKACGGSSGVQICQDQWGTSYNCGSNQSYRVCYDQWGTASLCAN